MRRLGMLAFLLAILLTMGGGPGYAHPVFAETVVEWDAAKAGGMSKGIVGQDGIRCHGEATYQGYTYRLTQYIGADADEMSANPAKERAWQENECRHDLAQQMGWWFANEYDNWYCNGAHMIAGAVPDENDHCYSKPALPGFDPSTIKVTITRV